MDLSCKLVSAMWFQRQKASNCFCLARQVFTGLDPLDWVTLLATVFPRCMSLAWHLFGSNCSAAAEEIPLQEEEVRQWVVLVREM